MERFTRTTCACKDCTACCKKQPGPLAPGDFERIANHLGESEEEAKKHFCASPGALVKNLLTGEVERIGTITPKRWRGRCVFLDENDRCKIHAVSPAGCAYFDTHMAYSVAEPRSLYLVRLQRHAEYQAFRNTLPYTQSYRPTIR